MLPSVAYRTSLWKVTQTWGWAFALSKDRKSRSTAQVQEHACFIIDLSTDWRFDVNAARGAAKQVLEHSAPNPRRVRPGAAASRDVSRLRCFRPEP